MADAHKALRGQPALGARLEVRTMLGDGMRGGQTEGGFHGKVGGGYPSGRQAKCMKSKSNVIIGHARYRRVLAHIFFRHGDRGEKVWRKKLQQTQGFRSPSHRYAGRRSYLAWRSQSDILTIQSTPSVQRLTWARPITQLISFSCSGYFSPSVRKRELRGEHRA